MYAPIPHHAHSLTAGNRNAETNCGGSRNAGSGNRPDASRNAGNTNASSVNASNTNEGSAKSETRENETAGNYASSNANAASTNKDSETVTTTMNKTASNMNAERRKDAPKMPWMISSATCSSNPKKGELIMKLAIKLSAVLSLLVIISAGTSFAAISSVNDIKSAKIGVLSGSVSEYLASEIVSGDSGKVIPYGSISEVISALRSRDIDAAVMDESPARYFAIGSSEFRILADPLESEYYAIAFKKGNPLRDDVDKALDSIIADKTLARIMGKYLDDDPDPANIDMNKGARGGKLWVGCAASFPPYEERISEGFVGIDIELCAAIAKRLGRELVVVDYRFDALPEALESGRIDMICSALAITEERLRTMDFTKPYDANQEVVLVLADGK